MSTQNFSVEIDKQKIENSIIEEVSSELMNRADLEERVFASISKRIDKLWSEKVENRIAKAVDDCANNGFEREYCKVDSFGKPVGEPTTISKELESLIQDYWTARVDRYGKPASTNYNTTSRAEWMMAQLAAKDFSETMKQHIVNVGADLKDGLRDELRFTLDKLLNGVFHVRSEGDRS